ncbi:MAG: hypothetical protein QGI24_06355 [Kiritimatiellia bacterium]|nr:hypothetical protein [Kiritimatiellia bacterium]
MSGQGTWNSRCCHFVVAVTAGACSFSTLLASLVFLLGLPPGVIVAADDAGGWVQERLEFEDPLPPGTPVKVVNHYGDVRVKGIKDDHLPVFAVLQKRTDTAFNPRVEIKHGEISTVTVVAGGAEGRSTGSSVVKDPGFRVDLAVFIPPASDVSVETGNGLIKVKGPKKRISATSVMGNITLYPYDQVIAETRDGTIQTMFKSGDWSGDSSFKTLTGDIWVRLPRPVDAKADVMTSGEIATDFSMDIKRPLRSRMKSGNARISESKNGRRGPLARGLRRIINPFRRVPTVEIESNIGSVHLQAWFAEWKESVEGDE